MPSISDLIHRYSKKAIIVFITVILLAITTACAINLDILIHRENELKRRNDFNSYAAREYLEYSRYLANQYDWHDSDFFAKKGLNAANNKDIYPEAPEAWYLDSNQLEEASLGRQRLELLLVPSAKQVLPIQLAHLLLLYDCWITREKEPWRIAEMSRCKVRFFKLIDEMESYMANLKPPEIVKENNLTPPEFKKFDIYFDLDSYRFNNSANDQLLQLFAHLATLNGQYKLLLVGNADASGQSLYNDNLARKRVLSVQNELVKNGVPSELISIQSFGENRPDIITKDNRRNKNNRMVGIYVVQGVDKINLIPLPLIDNYIYKQEILETKKQKGLQ